MSDYVSDYVTLEHLCTMYIYETATSNHKGYIKSCCSKFHELKGDRPCITKREKVSTDPVGLESLIFVILNDASEAKAKPVHHPA